MNILQHAIEQVERSVGVKATYSEEEKVVSVSLGAWGTWYVESIQSPDE